MGPTWVLRWAPCWPHEPCYQSKQLVWVKNIVLFLHMLLILKVTPSLQSCHFISVTPSEHPGISHLQQYNCLSNSFFRLTIKATSQLCNTGTLWGNPLVTIGSIHNRPVIQNMFPCHYDYQIFPVDVLILNYSHPSLKCCHFVSTSCIGHSEIYQWVAWQLMMRRQWFMSLRKHWLMSPWMP